MNLTEIKKRLEGFEKDIEEIISLFEQKHKHRDEIMRRYKIIKNLLKTERDKFQTLKGEEKATEEERQFYNPAVNEAWLELHTKVGSSPSQEMIDCLSSAKSEIRHYLG